jgi:hypothetical protein
MAGEEKTALEIILELPSILKKMESKIDVLDTNLKILNSKLNKMKGGNTLPDGKKEQEVSKQSVESNDVSQEDSRPAPSARPGPISPKEESPTKQKESSKLILGTVKVFSRIKTASGKPVEGMIINIFNNENELVRNILTDKEGYWECRLPSGIYSVEMSHPKLKTMNKQIEIKKDVKTYEVV